MGIRPEGFLFQKEEIINDYPILHDLSTLRERMHCFVLLASEVSI